MTKLYTLTVFATKAGHLVTRLEMKLVLTYNETFQNITKPHFQQKQRKLISFIKSQLQHNSACHDNYIQGILIICRLEFNIALKHDINQYSQFDVIN